MVVGELVDDCDRSGVFTCGPDDWARSGGVVSSEHAATTSTTRAPIVRTSRRIRSVHHGAPAGSHSNDRLTLRLRRSSLPVLCGLDR